MQILLGTFNGRELDCLFRKSFIPSRIDNDGQRFNENFFVGWLLRLARRFRRWLRKTVHMEDTAYQ